MNKFQKIFIAILISNFLYITTYSQSVKKITILHWNDLHSQNIPVKSSRISGIPDSVSVGGYAYLGGLIKKIKAEEKNVIVMNAGDDFQGSPVCAMTKGVSQIELMNLVHPDISTLGNHEFDYSADTLMKNLKKADREIIISNLVNKTTKIPFFKPYKIFVKDSVKIAIIGLITPELFEVSLPENLKNLELLDAIATTRKYIAELKKTEKPNLFIGLTHVGIEIDNILADSIPELNIIIGGHSHTLIKNPKKRNKTIICQAGSNGKFLGELDIYFDLKGDSIYKFEGKVIPLITYNIKPDLEIEKKVQELEKLVAAEMDVEIGILQTDWTRNSHGESNLGNWETDVMRKTLKADVAFLNNGGIRRDLVAGSIKIRDIWSINPFANILVSFSLRGDSLLKMMEFMAEEANEKMQISGIKYKYNLKMPAGQKIVWITVNNKKINKKKQYIIGASNFIVSQGLKYFGFEINPKKIKNTNLVDRDVFIEAVKRQKIINSKIEGRIIKINN